MRVFYELRVREKSASLVFAPDEGKLLSGQTIRKVMISSDDPRIPKIKTLQKELTGRNEPPLFFGWSIHFKYAKREFEEADLFYLIFESFFEPAGEECGTIYDETVACPVCGGGRKQVGPLLLKSSKIPKRKLVARTIASELIFSAELVEALEDAKVSGIDFSPVLDSKGKNKLTWYQPMITSSPISLKPPTLIGHGLFFDDPAYDKRCPVGIENHVLGCNLLSEVFVNGKEWDGSDFVRTKELIGYRSGLLVPYPLIFVSQKVRRVLDSVQGRGYSLEIVRFANGS